MCSDSCSNTNPQPFLDLRDRPDPRILRILDIGTLDAVNHHIMVQYQLRYAEPREWSRALPTINPGEVMRILTKRMPPSNL
ncbi:MAG: hypothetical protein ACFE0J_12445 [Elainellaceae cyanobacterium]